MPVPKLAEGLYFVDDDGPGIDGTPEEIARLFSIRRPLVSSKFLRLPTRGAVGNGLRVVAGAVLASGGTLIVIYGLRQLVMDELGEELKIGNFSTIITDYEAEHGPIPGMYREPRGSITHPHRDETLTLGDLMVKDYERPEWTFNKLVYIEKEGANEALKAVGWLERHDCAVMSSKGFSTRAARDLIDKLAEHD
jgi:hypothetical protein